MLRLLFSWLVGYPKAWRVWFGPGEEKLLVRWDPTGPFQLIDPQGGPTIWRHRPPPESVFRRPN